MSAHEDLRNMILSFRVSELSDLLGFAGRNKTGKKQELQSRALDLLKMRSAPVQMKIHELHKRRFNSGGMMGGSSMPDTLGPSKIPMGPSSDCPQQAVATCGPMHPSSSLGYQPNLSYNNASLSKPLTLMSRLPAPHPTYPIHPDVQLKLLPFYDILAVLVKPSSLIPSGNSSFQENSFEFHLSPQQVNDIVGSKHFNAVSSDYVNQIQLRFCLLETSCEQDDNFPPSILVKVNGKLCVLPNPIPTNRPGVEPKRPSRPVNITPISKLCATSGNIVSVSWACEYSRPYVLAIYLVKKLDSKTLMSRLRTKGMRNPDHTRAMIKEKLTPSPDSEIATTSLRGSLICPIGKKKMTEPCRPITCTHLQCFDADLFIKMNEKKPRWICPVCDKPAPFKSLAIDGLFSEISAKAPSSCHEVQFHEDGSWTPIISENDKKDMLDIDGSNHMRVHNPIKKKQKKNPEVVDLTCDSDTDEEWSSSSSIAPQLSSSKPSCSLDLAIASSSSIIYPSKPATSSNAPFVSLESPPTITFDGITPSPLSAPISSSSQSISAFTPISGQASNVLQPPASSSSRVKESSDLDQRYSIKEPLSSGFPTYPYMNSPSDHYYSPSSTPPNDDLGTGPSGYGRNDNSSFDLFSLLNGPDLDPRNMTTGNKSVPDIISLD